MTLSSPRINWRPQEWWRFVGTIQFVALQCTFVFCWVVFNLYLTHQAFDEYPFPLLATILALEAVLLTSCVLIRQNVIDRTL